MSPLYRVATLLIAMLLYPMGSAHSANVLEECMALSTELDDIHTCLDNYLDDMDESISDVASLIENEMTSDALLAFNQAQQAFVEYRRQNCLWYLEFSAPRSRAEQIAKNCLIAMSQQRLAELRNLLEAGDDVVKTVRGFYVYGASRNSFQPCDSDSRYWVEGENAAVSQLQQNYLNLATNELQVLHAVLRGTIDSEAQTVTEHDGVFELVELLDLRFPQEIDCRLPANELAGAGQAAISLSRRASDDVDQAVADEPSVVDDNDEPEQQLRAYFGEWLADCVQQKDLYECQLSVAFHDDSKKSTTDTTVEASPTLVLNRRSNERTTLQLHFPAMEIDDPAKIRWRVDAFSFDVLGSTIRVDELAAHQLISDSDFVKAELLPLMIKGGEIAVEVREDVDDSSGQTFIATLKGVSRALAFADDFVSGSGSL